MDDNIERNVTGIYSKSVDSFNLPAFRAQRLEICENTHEITRALKQAVFEKIETTSFRSGILVC